MSKVFSQYVRSVLPGNLLSPGQIVDSATTDTSTDTITATASGTITTAVLLTTLINRVTVVASANDAVRLPPALQGMKVIVSNAASNNLGVFPSNVAQGSQVSGGDAINGLSQLALYAQATGRQTFICFTTGTWQTA